MLGLLPESAVTSLAGGYNLCEEAGLVMYVVVEFASPAFIFIFTEAAGVREDKEEGRMILEAGFI